MVLIKSAPQAESMMAGGPGRVGLLGRVVGPVLVEVGRLPYYLLFFYVELRPVLVEVDEDVVKHIFQ